MRYSTKRISGQIIRFSFFRRLSRAPFLFFGHNDILYTHDTFHRDLIYRWRSVLEGNSREPSNRSVGCTWAKELMKNIVGIKLLRELPAKERKEGREGLSVNLIRRLDRICPSRTKNFPPAVVVRATNETRGVYKCEGETDRALEFSENKLRDRRRTWYR